MRSLGLLALCLTITCARASAQDPAADPKAGTLIDCGAEKVAIFANTTSKDGRYALGWTVRPNRKKDPVDWSIYKAKDQNRFFAKHPIAVEGDWHDLGRYNMGKQDYSVVDGVIDLNTKAFTPLLSNNPCFPGKKYWDVAVSWFTDPQGVRYAVTANQSAFETHDLWLVILKPALPQAIDLLSQANKAVTGSMLRRHPDADLPSAITYGLGDSHDFGGPPPVFKAGAVTLHFEAGYPGSEQGRDGYITFSLPQGKVTKTRIAE